MAKGQDHITVLKDPPVSDRYVSWIILTIIVQRTSSLLTQAILVTDGEHGLFVFIYLQWWKGDWGVEETGAQAAAHPSDWDRSCTKPWVTFSETLLNSTVEWMHAEKHDLPLMLPLGSLPIYLHLNISWRWSLSAVMAFWFGCSVTLCATDVCV